MLIVCPSCGIKYNVPASFLKKDRTLKCSGCGTDWVVPAVKPPEPAVDSTPPVVPQATIAPHSDVPDASPSSNDRQDNLDLPAVGEDHSAVSPEEQTDPLAHSPDDADTETAASAPVESAVFVGEAHDVHGVEPDEPVAPAVSADAVGAAEPPVPTHDHHGVAEDPVAEPGDAGEGSSEESSPEAASDRHEAAESAGSETDDSEPVTAERRDVGREPEPEVEPEGISAIEEAPAVELPASEPHPHTASDEAEAGQSTAASFVWAATDQAEEHDEAHQPHTAEADASVDPEEAAPSASDVQEPVSEPHSFHEPHDSVAGEGVPPDLDKQFDHLRSGPVEFDEAALDSWATGIGAQDHTANSNRDEGPFEAPGSEVPSTASSEPYPIEPAPEPSFDDVVTRLRAARMGRAAVESAHADQSDAGRSHDPHSPAAPHHPDSDSHQSDNATAEGVALPWVPAWERSESEEEHSATQHETPAHGGDLPVWATEDDDQYEDDLHDHDHNGHDHNGHDQTFDESVSDLGTIKEAPAGPTADIAARLRSDILNRTTVTRPLIERPEFWRRAWIASGVCAVGGIAAAVHWFGALRHIFPALGLL